jgi:hypothetical protein
VRAAFFCGIRLPVLYSRSTATFSPDTSLVSIDEQALKQALKQAKAINADKVFNIIMMLSNKGFWRYAIGAREARLIS